MDEFKDTARIVVASLILVICVVGLVANFFVIFVILVLKEHKKAVTNWFMFQLAIADTLFLLTLPFKASQNLNESWVYSIGLCKAQESILYINYFASIMFLVVMGVDRYVAVCHTMSNSLQNLRKPIASYIVTFCIWGIAIGMAVPIMLFTQVAGVEPNCLCRGEFPRNLTLECLMHLGPNADEMERARCQRHSLPNRTFCAPRPPDNINLSFLSGSGDEMMVDKESLPFPSIDSNFVMMENGSTTNSIEILPTDESELTMSATDVIESFTSAEASTKTTVTRRPMVDGVNFLSRECNYFQYPDGWYIYIRFIFYAMFVTPLVIMSFCYGLIIFKILESSKATSSRMDNDRKRITIMCIILVCAFVVGWTWFHAIHLAKIDGIPLTSNHCIVLTEIGTLLAYFHSALNPMLYIFLGSGFSKKWQAVKESPTTRYIITLKTRSTDFFHTNSRLRTKTMDKSSSHVPSHDTGLQHSAKSHSNSVSTKQATALSNGSSKE